MPENLDYFLDTEKLQQVQDKPVAVHFKNELQPIGIATIGRAII
jgi:hypothetical protein